MTAASFSFKGILRKQLTGWEANGMEKIGLICGKKKKKNTKDKHSCFSEMNGFGYYPSLIERQRVRMFVS